MADHDKGAGRKSGIDVDTSLVRELAELLAGAGDEVQAIRVFVAGGGCSGLGFGMTIDPARALVPGSAGEFYWGGIFSTAFFVDPVEKIHAVFMTQLYPSFIYPIRRQLKTLIYSALATSRA